MNVRHATIEDMKTISDNNIQMAQESEGVILPNNVAQNAVKSLINDETKGFYLVAEEKNQIIGQLMITYEWSDWRDSTIWWIQSVFVTPAHRKKGVFKQLYETVQTLAKENNIHLIRLYVHTENTSAIKVYEAIGMKQKSYRIFETFVT